MIYPHLHLPLIRLRASELADRAQRLGPQLAALDARPEARLEEPVTMRLGTLADTRELEELAQLDSASLPAMPWLIGERAERVVVALSLGDGAIIANPFVPTADVIALLRVRALQLSSNPPRRGITWQRRHLRSFALR